MIPERTSKSIEGLELMCRQIGDGERLIEIGGWTGAGTAIFRAHFQKVWVVDPWEKGAEIASIYPMAQVEALFDKRHSGGNVIKLKMTSARASQLFQDGFFDAVYIDGLHDGSEPARDIEFWRPKVKAGGHLCGHDYCAKFPAVKAAVDQFLKKEQRSVKLYPDASWSVKC